MIKTVLKFASLSVLIAGLVSVTACTQSGQTEESAEDAAAENTEVTDEAAEETPPPASPRANVETEVSGVAVIIDWGSPGVKERTIWGELVPYGEVWRAGANETTNVEFAADVVIGDTKVAAGKYGLFIIPQQEGDWTVILNTSWDREEHGIWGSMGYDEANDVVRVMVTPTWAEESAERLAFGADGGALTFEWEKARLSVPVTAAE